MSDPTIVSDSRMMMGKPAAGTDATVDLPPIRRSGDFDLKSSTQPVVGHKAKDAAGPPRS